jgi:(1->4)-alpha-D-glucan 1-alpha-D-glucosylmutase
MSKGSALDRLAAMMGIEDEFRDARGQTVRASTATKRHLLTAMGVALKADSDADAALAQMQMREWQRPLPPVHVALAEMQPAARRRAARGVPTKSG